MRVHKNSNEYEVLLKFQGVSILLLFFALFPLPYDYYEFLRLYIFIVIGVSTYFLYQKKKKGYAFVFGVIAIMYNPIYPFHLNRDFWIVFDVISAVVIGSNLYEEYA